jgi:hypothetical protein
VRVLHLQKNKIPHFELKRVLRSWCCIASITRAYNYPGSIARMSRSTKSFTNLLHYKSANTVRYEDKRIRLYAYCQSGNVLYHGVYNKKVGVHLPEALGVIVRCSAEGCMLDLLNYWLPTQKLKLSHWGSIWAILGAKKTPPPTSTTKHSHCSGGHGRL